MLFAYDITFHLSIALPSMQPEDRLDDSNGRVSMTIPRVAAGRLPIVPRPSRPLRMPCTRGRRTDVRLARLYDKGGREVLDDALGRILINGRQIG